MQLFVNDLFWVCSAVDRYHMVMALYIEQDIRTHNLHDISMRPNQQ